MVLGSPGLDVDAAEQLDTEARLWVGSAEDGWIRRIPEVRVLGLGHGVDPSRPSFGARTLDVTGAEGYDGYFLSGITSLESLAAVSLGTSCPRDRSPPALRRPPRPSETEPSTCSSPGYRRHGARPLAGIRFVGRVRRGVSPWLTWRGSGSAARLCSRPAGRAVAGCPDRRGVPER
ncbi:alpha/beta hydrolase [Salinispora arenicola]|uniref:alpha/beta hydrolase n=1 Tax=Salinispora arenicola TaxID=168697 RepID=UPI002E3303A5|nr:alpha/beta hydrolase [Salinispora arenicola]